MTLGQKIVTTVSSGANSGDAQQHQSSNQTTTFKIIAKPGTGQRHDQQILIPGTGTLLAPNSGSSAATFLQQIANANNLAPGQTVTLAIKTPGGNKQVMNVIPRQSVAAGQATINVSTAGTPASVATSSALVAALSGNDNGTLTTVPASSNNGQLLRSLTTSSNQKGNIPFVLMPPTQQQPQQNPGTVITSVPQGGTRTINILTSQNLQTQQTKTLTLQAPRPASVGPLPSASTNTTSNTELTLNVQTPNKSATPPVSASASSPLIEALMSPVGKRAVGGSPSHTFDAPK